MFTFKDHQTSFWSIRTVWDRENFVKNLRTHPWNSLQRGEFRKKMRYQKNCGLKNKRYRQLTFSTLTPSIMNAFIFYRELKARKLTFLKKTQLGDKRS